ncbi:hypothetical protein ABD91_21415 [Lysinibacillus sphaericus]|uniref:hypothetical protein n=1 Tax=Lysinibacillus sphaericus TaxID=1421 RepID=UPI0018CD8462|nr:hypothetical protein [Lysinibacillus sphaericus]MBG9693297.1 hypothetical protein [Lysinibacillus sphaericus]
MIDKGVEGTCKLNTYVNAISYLTLEIEKLKKIIKEEAKMAHMKSLLEKRLKELEQDLVDIQQYQLD